MSPGAAGMEGTTLHGHGDLEGLGVRPHTAGTWASVAPGGVRPGLPARVAGALHAPCRVPCGRVSDPAARTPPSLVPHSRLPWAPGRLCSEMRPHPPCTPSHCVLPSTLQPVRVAPAAAPPRLSSGPAAAAGRRPGAPRAPALPLGRPASTCCRPETRASYSRSGLLSLGAGGSLCQVAVCLALRSSDPGL